MFQDRTFYHSVAANKHSAGRRKYFDRMLFTVPFLHLWKKSHFTMPPFVKHNVTTEHRVQFPDARPGPGSRSKVCFHLDLLCEHFSFKRSAKFPPVTNCHLRSKTEWFDLGLMSHELQTRSQFSKRSTTEDAINKRFPK